MDLIERFEAWLEGLTEVVKRHSANDAAMREAIVLREIAMSHGDLANLLRGALRAKYSAPNTFAWIRDVYDDSVVYEVETSTETKLYQASYALLDGQVQLGDPIEVVQVSQYVPVGEAERAPMTERQFSQDKREELAKKGHALPDGSFPIVTMQDLRNAIKAFGRAKDKTAAKRHIIKRARALGATDELPEEWRASEEADRADEAERMELAGDLVPLVERAVRKDGTISIKVIEPGQGSSGYYPADVLKRDGPKVFTKGLQMFLDHPTAAEESDRPERSIRDLAGVLVSDARWEENGPVGPGLYAEARVRSDLAPLIEEIAPHIGVSIRALGRAKSGEVDGRKTRVIEEIEQAKSVDFVTQPGAGGKVLQLLEAARDRQQPNTNERKDETVSQEELNEARRIIDEQGKELARLREAVLLREARDVVAETLKAVAMPEPTRVRLCDSLVANPPLKDGELDRDALRQHVQEAVKSELEYLAKVTGSGRVIGMGSTQPTAPNAEDASKSLQESFERILGDTKLAEIAAQGRA